MPLVYALASTVYFSPPLASTSYLKQEQNSPLISVCFLLQNHQIIDVSNQISPMMNSSTTRKTDMEKPSLAIQQQAVQKCPRCDSINTKFCYYNNYSLTQPRHFCKACKRYWTRGGTLRNVPVGGGCRRNKRLKRPSSSSSSSLNNHHSGTSSLVVVPSSTTTNNHSMMNPLFYGLPSNPSDLNHHLQFSGYDNLDLDHHGQHQQHHAGGNLGLGFFSSGLVLNDDYRNGFASDSILSSYGGSSSSSPMFGSSVSTNSSTTPTMSAIIANNYHLKTLPPFENMEINGEQSGGSTGVKLEGRFGNWSVPSSQMNQIQQFDSSTENNPSMYWSNTNWPNADLTNIGSSVTSLI